MKPINVKNFVLVCGLVGGQSVSLQAQAELDAVTQESVQSYLHNESQVMNKLRQIEAERQAELERQRQAELERQRQAELERQRQAELERQRKAELERQKQSLIYISKTNLTWMKCSIGQVWRNQACQGKAKKLTWQQAMDYSKKINFAGYSDWRVPTLKELKTLVKKGRKPTIDSDRFPNTPSAFYWSSTPNAYSNFNTWGVHFSYGNSSVSSRNSYNVRVRLVRSGQ